MQHITMHTQYADHAPHYDEYIDHCGYARIPPLLVAAFRAVAGDLPAGARVLDLGSGTGRLTAAMDAACPGLRITGLEPCPEMAEIFEDRFAEAGNITLKPGGYKAGGKTRRLPFDGKSFDAVISTGVFDHFEITRRTMKDVMGLVKPGGFLAMTYERHSRLLPVKHIAWSDGEFHSHSDSHVRSCLKQVGAVVLDHQRMIGYTSPRFARFGMIIAQRPLLK